MSRAEAPDPVDAAIAKIDAERERPKTFQRMVETPIKLSTGRVVVVAVPPDVTDAEALEWTAWFLGTLIPDLRKRQASPLVVVQGRA